MLDCCSQSMPSRAKGGTFSTRLFLFLSIFGLVGIHDSSGQVASNSQPSTPSPATAQLAAYKSEQQALAASFQQLVAQGATSEQLEAWKHQNSDRLAALQQQAQEIAGSQQSPVVQYLTGVEVPDGASQAMEDFLTQGAKLYNARAQIHNEQLHGATVVNEEEVEVAFQAQNADALSAQTQRAQSLAQEADSQPLPDPPPLVIPSGANETLKQFLTLRDQLAREEIQTNNQNLSLSSADRAAALDQWRQENNDRFEQLQSLAKALSSS